MSSKLFVGNLSYSTGEAELRQAFEAHGALRSVAIITDRVTGRPRGFGFVEFERAEDAQNAISALDGQLLDGRPISVNVARERERTPRFSNDGGGGGYRGGGGPRGSGGRDFGGRGGSSFGDGPSYGDGGFDGGGFGGDGEGRGQRSRRGGGKGRRGSSRW